MKPKSDQLEPNSHPSRWVLLTLGWELWVPSLAITKVWVLIFRESAGWRFHLISACYSAFIRALRKINWQSHVNNGTQKANPSASNSCRSQQSWSALSVKTIASSRNSPPLCYFFFSAKSRVPTSQGKPEIHLSSADSCVSFLFCRTSVKQKLLVAATLHFVSLYWYGNAQQLILVVFCCTNATS